MTLIVNVISYRKLAFARAFGFTVRDLMMLKALESSVQVSRIHWYERPDLPHELVKRLISPRPEIAGKTEAYIGIDLMPFGGLVRGRLWVAASMRRHDIALIRSSSRSDGQTVILDYNPFYIPPLEAVRDSFYWYDLIDNFTKHNRFSSREIKAVHRKYDFVREHANIVTGVTDAAVAGFPNARTVANRLLRPLASEASAIAPTHDLGFLGFITDKFDIDFVEAATKVGLTVLVCGHAYDRRVLDRLKLIPGLTYHGPFAAWDVPRLTARFTVGMIPYKLEKSHDESPIKFFQYVLSGRPVVMPQTFGAIEASFAGYTHFYCGRGTDGLVDFVRRFQSDGGAAAACLRTQALSHHELFWENMINDLIAKVSGRTSERDGVLT